MDKETEFFIKGTDTLRARMVITSKSVKLSCLEWTCRIRNHDYVSYFNHYASLMKRLVYLIILLISAICFCSCRTKYVPVESVRTEIEYRDRWQRDSIHVHDSIHVREKGDTVFVDRWHTEYKDRNVRDTLYIEKTDSVQVPYPVERALTRWQSVKQEIGGIAMGGIIVLCLVLAWLIRKNRKR